MKITAGLWTLALVAAAFVPCYGDHGHRQPRRGHSARMRRRYDSAYNYKDALSTRRRSKPGELFCPMGYVTLWDHCYHFSDSPATWNQALVQCRHVGGTLAVLETEEEIRGLKRYLGHSSVASLRRWIGPIYNWMQKKWIWGPSGQDITILDFSTDETIERMEPGPWTCGAMDQIVSYQWEPVSCFEDLYYICETAPEFRKNDQQPFNYEAYQSRNLDGEHTRPYSRIPSFEGKGIN